MTLEELDRLKARMAKVEDAVNDIITVLNKMSTASAISRLVGHLEESITALAERITTLEANVEELKNDPYNEEQD